MNETLRRWFSSQRVLTQRFGPFTDEEAYGLFSLVVENAIGDEAYCQDPRRHAHSMSPDAFAAVWAGADATKG